MQNITRYNIRADFDIDIDFHNTTKGTLLQQSEGELGIVYTLNDCVWNSSVDFQPKLYTTKSEDTQDKAGWWQEAY